MDLNRKLSLDAELLPASERVLAAVSGGADSMALLWVLQSANLPVICAHINHGLRGAESDADEAFVVEHCHRLGIPVVARRVEVRTVAGHASEGAAREARYVALVEIAAEHACSRLATGHSATDLLETVLINWMRGAAITGLRGIQAQRSLTESLFLVRPLLQLTREEARALCRAAGWPWREDSSNLEPKFLRNRIRHELFPALEQVLAEQGGVERLARQTVRAAQVFQDDLDFLEAVATEALRDVTITDEPMLIVLNGLRFRRQPAALQRRILRAAAERMKCEAIELDSELIETVRRHIVQDRRRAVWQWRYGINVEWTGAEAGNRIRLWLVTNRKSA